MFTRDDKISLARLTFVQYAILALFVFLVFGLWRLQVLGSERYQQLAQMNRVRPIPLLAPRGRILDRQGRVIVDNYPSFSALLHRDNKADEPPDYATIARGLNMTEEDIRDRLRRMGKGSAPVVLKDDITPDELAFIEAHRNELPQLETIMVHRRLYPTNGFAAHMIGYVSEVSEEMLDLPGYELYEAGDIVGRSGVEYSYNHVLMGQNGQRNAIVNSRGREVGRLNETPPVPGERLQLTIDLDLQIAAEEALEGHNGAIVALDPRTGEVLAMASRPTFDPNHFAVRISAKEWNALITDPAKPLLNKAIQAQLAPGSVFKIIMAAAGAQEGITDDLVVNCGGGKNFYGRFFNCWEKRGPGTVELSKAIYQSCDTYFYTLGERLGIGRIAKYAQAFGLGSKTGIDLPQETSGVMPSEEWKVRNFKQKWYAGETISVAIGQGAVTTTPIQLARAIGAIAMGGVMHRPHLVAFDELKRLKLPLDDEAAGRTQVALHQHAWEQITDAMVNVVQPGGTAASARLEGIDFAGKTGSAQVVSLAARAKLGGHQYKDNGWFVGVSPRRNSEIVVAVLVEQGEHGYLAARLTAQVVKAYVEKQRRRQQDQKIAKAEIAGVWTATDAHGHEKLEGGRFEVTMAAPSPPMDIAPFQVPAKVALPEPFFRGGARP
jgi:penicillin-binding protein 2